MKQQYKALQKESIRKVKEALRGQAQEEEAHKKDEQLPQTKLSQEQTKQAESKSEQPASKTAKIKELPFIPGVVLRLQCLPFEMSKDDVKVNEQRQTIREGIYWVLFKNMDCI